MYLRFWSTPQTVSNGGEMQGQSDANGYLKVVIAAAGTLPTGASTSAKQDTQITAEQAIQATAGATTGAAVVTDANGTIQQYLRGLIVKILVLIAQFPASLGSKAATASLSVVPGGLQYETVAASQTAQVLGATGATGDFLSHVIIQPVTTAAGTCTILDNAIVIFTFTTGTLADLRPITVPVNAFSVSGAWKCTSGANVTMTGFGTFT